MQFDFTLSFTKNQWICSNDTVNIIADSLEEVDDAIEKHLREKHKKGKFKINMYFDFDRFPMWHRQYMPHYFNREFTFSIT